MMEAEELKTILDKHKDWLSGICGERANLCRADLCEADLLGANLCRADLREANLCRADLREADLLGADLEGAHLEGAHLREANLREANLRGANLRGADLRGASLCRAYLSGADLDFACWPLWCGSLDAKIDACLAAQLMYHAMRAMKSVTGDPDVAAVLSDPNCLRLADRFHRADECGRLSAPDGVQESEAANG